MPEDDPDVFETRRNNDGSVTVVPYILPYSIWRRNGAGVGTTDAGAAAAQGAGKGKGATVQHAGSVISGSSDGGSIGSGTGGGASGNVSPKGTAVNFAALGSGNGATVRPVSSSGGGGKNSGKPPGCSARQWKHLQRTEKRQSKLKVKRARWKQRQKQQEVRQQQLQQHHQQPQPIWEQQQDLYQW